MKRLALVVPSSPASTALPRRPAQPHNVVIFVADGLRYGSVTPEIAPTMSRIRREGVDFTNSHSIYPTLTTANASAIATGHFLGDTGDYANVIYTGFPVTALAGSNVPFLENDAVLQEVKAHFPRRLYGTDLASLRRARGGLFHRRHRQDGPGRHPGDRLRAQRRYPRRRLQPADRRPTARPPAPSRSIPRSPTSSG